MTRRSSRRAILKTSAIGLLGSEVVSGTKTTAARSTVTTAGAHNVCVSAREHDHRGHTGGILEDLSGIDESFRIADLHTFVWDDGEANTGNVRDDGRNVSVRKAADAPEVTIDGQIRIEAMGGRSLYGGTYYVGDVVQRALVARDRPAILIDTEISFFWPDEDIYGFNYDEKFGDNERTIYTLLNPQIGDADNEAWTTSHEGYDILVARGGTRYVAVGHRAGDRITFDGHCIGRTDGTEKSAWQDIYGETENGYADWRNRYGDGWLDSNEYNEGPIDVAFGNYIGTADEAEWQVALGFGTSEDAAVTSAVGTLRRGYDAERDQYEQRQ
ncbi:hypothetical protein [Natrinema halophilum]|uniref:Glucodextranase N-terminal domain-containing protein n=1 Tax=Natrinema halophilum TaxID=1699371 RepID=A0A7D5KHA4_9EURY|nr:hypothetical protein [Natrinema halophilum]QLG47519.1 hypothetical protein HYG82_00990 [Natrinema halophilum]